MKRISILFISFLALSSFAQTGGTTTFAILDLTYNARAAGLGNDFISIKDQDINLGILLY
jgi:hypothetical protein